MSFNLSKFQVFSELWSIFSSYTDFAANLIISDTQPVCLFRHQKHWLLGHPTDPTSSPVVLNLCVYFLFSLKTWEDLPKSKIYFVATQNQFSDLGSFIPIFFTLNLNGISPENFICWNSFPSKVYSNWTLY